MSIKIRVIVIAVALIPAFVFAAEPPQIAECVPYEYNPKKPPADFRVSKVDKPIWYVE